MMSTRLDTKTAKILHQLQQDRLQRSRVKNNLDYELIDKRVRKEIQTLWDKGITTTSSCDGHGKFNGYIKVLRCDVKKMEQLGYKHVENPYNECFFYCKGRKWWRMSYFKYYNVTC